MKRIPRKLGLLLTGFAGIFGIRTPPEPQVIAQMQSAQQRPARSSAPTEVAAPGLDEPPEEE